MATSVPTLPPFPGRSSPPDDYIPVADTFAAALQPWGVAVNAVGQEAAAAATSAEADAAAAALSAFNAAAFATIAENAALTASQVGGAPLWEMGPYDEGAAAVSPSNYLLYRRKAPGGYTEADPATDAENWEPGVAAAPLSLDMTTATPTIQMNVENRFQGGVQQLATVPSTDLSAHSTFWIRVCNGRYDNLMDFGSIPVNGILCNASTGYLRLDDAFASACFRYVPGSGWRL